MMRLLALSDSHGNAQALRALAPFIEALRPDHIAHLGDYASDGQLLAACAGREVIQVRGNGDFAFGELPAELVLELGAAKILLTHGHQHAVKSGLSRLCERAGQLGCAAALFGHTHLPHCEKTDGIWLVNPGALADPADPRRKGLAVLEAEGDALRAALL
ncbi:MAG: metallophosphoesterase [Christensenellaceae bacterium]|jgi:putative phosphoesterase|nr:metallophosphoesterase [Christensenellaceae bacterium]